MMTSADPNRLALPALFGSLVDPERLERLLDLALEEDLGTRGDVTTRCFVEPRRRARTAVVAREEGVVAGIPALERLLLRWPRVRMEAKAADGDRCRAGATILECHGPLDAILPIERTLLNLLGRLCGVATLTRTFVDAIAGTRARLCCTRKTLPGWRELDKYAVRCGGGHLHRIGLYDAVLVKDNHVGALRPIEFAERIAEGAARARAEGNLRFVEVEVDTLEQFDLLLGLPAGALDIVLLDNFDPARLAEAVRRRDARRPELELEASGGVRLATVRTLAETGVDRISCGAITHSAPALDLGLDLVEVDAS